MKVLTFIAVFVVGTVVGMLFLVALGQMMG